MNNVLYLSRRCGIPALAYPATDASIPWPCTLKILQTDLGTKFTVSLESHIMIHGVDDEQLFTLRFEGDNLMPGKSSLARVDIVVSAEHLHSLIRQGQPRVQMLSLFLKAPCAVWCPGTGGTEASSIDTSSQELIALAKTTEVHILFDTNWLGQNLARLRSVVESSPQLTGVPISADSNFTRSYRKANWSVFNFVKEAKSRVVPSVEDELAGAPPPIEDTVGDAPPPYVRLSRKRSRLGESSTSTYRGIIINACNPARTSLTPETPSPKRVLLEDLTCPPSPSERATLVSSPSAKSGASSTATEHVDIFQEAMTTAVKALLPTIVREMLPDIVRDILPRLLAVPQSPSSSSARTPPCHPQLPTVPTISALLGAHVSTHLKQIYVDALNKASDQASEFHDSVGLEISEVLDEHRIDVLIVKEDAIAELHRECDEKLVEFKERVAEVKEAVEEGVALHADNVVGKACDRLDAVELKMNKVVRSRCIDFHDAKAKNQLRAISLPL